jgi:drug/metabolite transporter (DMT)-like permease
MSTRRDRLTGYACIALSMILVGGGVPVVKLLVGVFPVFILLALRSSAALVVNAPLAAHREGLRLRMGRRTFWLMMVQCVTGTFLFNIFLMYGIRMTDALSAGVILATLPAAAAGIGALVLREKLGRWQYAAMALSVLGLVLVNTAGASAGASSLLGNLLVFAAVVIQGMFLTVARLLAGRVPPVQQAMFLNLVAIIMFLPFAAWEWVALDFAGTAPSFWYWLLGAAHGITTGVVAVLLYYRALRSVTAAQAAPFTGLTPVATATVAVLALGEPLTAPLAGGMALVLAAIWCGTRPAVRT